MERERWLTDGLLRQGRERDSYQRDCQDETILLRDARQQYGYRQCSRQLRADLE